MALLDSSKKEINAKIVYYGPGLSGKTSNIQFVYKKLRPEHKGKLMTLATQTDRTLFFDFLPVELGEIRGMKVRFQIYTVPGQVFYNATRKLVLKNVDGIIFVADSQKKVLNENIESLKNLEDNLQFYNKRLQDIPLVFQYNKRDLGEAIAIEELQGKLNRWGAPSFEAVAQRGDGVLQTLTTITKLVIQKLKMSADVSAQDTVPPQPSGKPKEYVPSDFSREGRPHVSGQGVVDATVTARTTSVVLTKKDPDLEIIDLGKPERISSNVFQIPLILKGHDSSERLTLTITITLDI